MANIKILDLNGLKTVFGVVDSKIAVNMPKKLSELVNDANFATLAEVEAKVAEGVSTVDLSLYETKANAEATYQPKGDYLTEHQSLDNYYTKADADAMAVAKAKAEVAALVDEAPETFDTLKEIADYIEQHQSVADSLNAAISAKANASDVYNKTEVDSKIADAVSGGVGAIDLSIYETKENASATYQPKGDYLTEQNLAGYATESWVEGKGYLTSHQSLDAYAKTADFVAFTAEEIEAAAREVEGSLDDINTVLENILA